MFGHLGEKKNVNKFQLYEDDDSEETKPKRFMTMNSPVNKMEISVFSDKYDIYGESPDDWPSKKYQFRDADDVSLSRGLTLKRAVREKTEEQLNIITSIFEK